MVSLVGIKGAVVSILGGLFADGQNLKVMFGGGFRDPFSAVKLADHGIRRAFDDSGLIAVKLDHVFHGLAFFLGCLILGGLLAPQKLYCITYAMMGIYVLGVEFLWHFLGDHPGWKNRRLLLILGKLIIFNLMWL